MEVQSPSSFHTLQNRIYGIIQSLPNTDYSITLTPYTPTEEHNFFISQMRYDKTNLNFNFPKIVIKNPASITENIPDTIFSQVAAHIRMTVNNISKKIQNPKLIVKLIGDFDELKVATS